MMVKYGQCMTNGLLIDCQWIADGVSRIFFWDFMSRNHSVSGPTMFAADSMEKDGWIFSEAKKKGIECANIRVLPGTMILYFWSFNFFVRFAACIPILSHPNALCVLLLWEKTRTQAKLQTSWNEKGLYQKTTKTKVQTMPTPNEINSC